ncbi:hypothetical protein DAPPUDRAFT_233419 [Daphnia pulex]|uniref:Uncharacterized protein n=1 Tax=Daphnia pulex TaxID=6669 RepID=E9FU06_DAPPU|nr:hypothetical protein DAPPUDRAFT_233419 [Daphnia pulex]|eukprot:EFX89550.1 hypothetical protein DAPPUDRAFT_233419 [Daphnia pulex]
MNYQPKSENGIDYRRKNSELCSLLSTLVQNHSILLNDSSLIPSSGEPRITGEPNRPISPICRSDHVTNSYGWYFLFLEL